MKPLILSAIFLLVILASFLPVSGQQNFATNVKTEISDDKMLITYDAPARDGTPYYSIILMITYNGKAIQANSMFGDYGSKVEPGMEKAITWYYTNDFKEDIKKVSVSVFAYKVNEPKVYFSIISKSNNGYAPCEVRVSNSSTNVNEYKWDFNDPESGINNLSTEKEPVHVFERAGIYNISLTGRNSLLGLEGTSFNTVEIKEHDPTVADFSFTISGSKPPYEVKFTSLSKNGDILAWNFGDPGAKAKDNFSDKPNPVYKYKQAGTYMVELTAKSTVSGLSDKVTKEVKISAPLNPAAGFVYTLSQESAPAIVQFKNTSTNADNFKWTFGDPESANQNSSAEIDPAHTYLKAGKFEVVLIASNAAGKSNKFSNFVTVLGPPKPPVAGFKIGNNNVIGPVTISFTNTSTDADIFSWDFGDPASGSKNSSSDASPVHTYTNPGKYTVVLRAASTKTNESNQFIDYVTIMGATKPPVASFEISNNNAAAPATVQFLNKSTNASLYAWDFGDPGSGSANGSSEANPSHVFATPGSYKVILTAKNAAGNTHSFSANVAVREAAKLPRAGFTAENNNAAAPATIRFRNSSENAVSYKWDFGDPASALNTSTDANPTHKYGKAGRYSVTLTAKSTSGATDVISSEVTVAETPKAPVARFTIDNNNQVSPAEVSFTNTSSNAVQYSWNFGDPTSIANTSSEENPVHTFLKAGKYRVVMTAKNSLGAVSTWSENVTVLEPAKPPVAGFSVENNNAPYPVAVRFKNTSTNGEKYMWDFGDPSSGSNTSEETNPVHTYYKAGSYNVILTVKNKSGVSDSYTKVVTVAEAEKLPVAKFTFADNNQPAPATVSFSNSSSNAVQYSWTFGDPSSSENTSSASNPAHTYLKAGKYTVTLTASNKSGKVSTWTESVTVVEPEKPAVAKFSAENDHSPSPATIRFKNLSSDAVEYGWDFGDPASGSNTSAESSPSHTYLKAGKYTVTLTAKNKSGATSGWTETVTVVEPELIPSAKFTIDNNNSFSPATVRFTNSSVNSAGYSWDFGDPASGVSNRSTDESPVHIYGKPGKYSVTLTARNDRGTSRVFSDYVTVVAPPEPPVAGFAIENNHVIGPATVSFSNSSANATVYEWDFGDPDSGTKNRSADANPVHTYLKPGTYTVKLTASEQITGKSSETSGLVTILEPVYPPVADFSFTLSGQYAPVDVTFSNKSENADSYKWSFGDSQSGSNESTGASPVHRFENPGTYKITLEARSSKAGKSHVSIKEITISERYKTFLKTFGKRGNDEVATSLISPKPGEYVALVNEQKEGSTLVTFDREGKRFMEKKLNSSMYDITELPGNKGYLLSGIGYPNDLIVQVADKQLNTGNQAIAYSNVYDPGYRFVSLHAAFSSAGELGIVANLVNDANQSNIWFQKTGADGKPIVARGKTFKYVGYKLANQVIATGNGEFAVIGSYQQDTGSPGEMMLGMVNSDGSGKISSMRSKLKLTGCDLLEVKNGNFEVLAARESPGNPDFSELSLKLVDRELNPMNCEIDLVGLMRTPDFKLFPPRLMAVEEGFILLSHVFNGTDSDIALLWIDKGGSILLRKEEIRRPGDQFGTALFRESDGSFVITGAERNGGDFDAIIIKTDKQGKYSDPGPESGK